MPKLDHEKLEALAYDIEIELWKALENGWEGVGVAQAGQCEGATRSPQDRPAHRLSNWIVTRGPPSGWRGRFSDRGERGQATPRAKRASR